MTRLAWIVAVTLGLTAGGFAFHFPGSYGNSVLDPALNDGSSTQIPRGGEA